MGFIYEIYCYATGKAYVGQTRRTVNERWKEHMREGEKYAAQIEAGEYPEPSCTALYRAMHKHGIRSFSVSTLVQVNNDQLDKYEMMFISRYNCIVPQGYNLKSGGDSSTHNDETRALMSVKARENRSKDFAIFRKHNEISDLPIHCIHIDGGVAINKHPLCNRKSFMIKKYGSIDLAKESLLQFLKELEAGIVTHVRLEKKEKELPKGVRRINDAYFVDKRIKGVFYRRYFGTATVEENKQNALEYLAQITKECSPTTKCQLGAEEPLKI